MMSKLRNGQKDWKHCKIGFSSRRPVYKTHNRKDKALTNVSSYVGDRKHQSVMTYELKFLHLDIYE